MKNNKAISGRPGASLKPVDFDKLKSDLLKKHGDGISDKDVLSAALYPKVFDDFHTFVDKYGPVDKLDTCTFLQGLDIGDEISVCSAVISSDNCDIFGICDSCDACDCCDTCNSCDTYDTCNTSDIF